MQEFKKYLIIIATLLITLCISAPAMADPPGGGSGTTPTTQNSSTKDAIQCGVNSASSGNCKTQPSGDLNTTISRIINLLSLLTGVIAVIMLIIGGLRFVTSAGNPEASKGARNTITYALIGLVVVAIAQSVVRFVLQRTT